MTKTPRTPFLEIDNRISLFYKDWGVGKPVLFIASALVNSDIWQYQMNYLSNQDVRCLAYDRRGHGRSSQPGSGYDFDTLADDLAALINQLDLRDLTLVGHSMGAGEIVRYLSRYGTDRVERVVFIAPTTPFLLKTSDNPNGTDRSLFEEVRSTLSKDFPKWLADNARPFVVPETSPEMLQWVTTLAQQCSLKAVLDCNVSVTETDFRAELHKVAVPTLIIHGDTDVSAPIDLTGRETARLIPGCQFKLYEGAPHGLILTHMDRLNTDLLAFIRS